MLSTGGAAQLGPTQYYEGGFIVMDNDIIECVETKDNFCLGYHKM